MIKVDNDGKPERCIGEAISEKAKAFTKAQAPFSKDDFEFDIPDSLLKIREEDFLKSEVVNHPEHYNTGDYECIDVMEECFGTEAVKDFCVCNAFKYLWRCKEKHETPIEDIKKAVWYLNKYLELSSYDD